MNARDAHGNSMASLAFGATEKTMPPMSRLKITPLLLTSLLLLAGCAGAQVTQTPAAASATPVDSAAGPIYGQSGGEVRSPLTARLVLSHAPRLNELAQVTLVITSTLDAPGTTAEIVLPPGAVATAGALTWTGDLRAQQPLRVQATIKFVQEGNWTLTGKALRPAGDKDVWGDMSVIYLHVTREAGQAGFGQEPATPHTGGQAPPSITP